MRCVRYPELVDLKRGKRSHAPRVFRGFSSRLHVAQVALELASREDLASAADILRVGRGSRTMRDDGSEHD